MGVPPPPVETAGSTSIPAAAAAAAPSYASGASSSRAFIGGGVVIDANAEEVDTAGEIDLLATLTGVDQDQPQDSLFVDNEVSASHIPAGSTSHERSLSAAFAAAFAAAAATANGATTTPDITVGDEDNEGSADEGEPDDNGSPDTAAGAEAAGEGGENGGSGGGTKKKKKKKKPKRKSNKSGKMTWTGEEDETGKRLTLRANKGGGGVVVEGLSEVLAASDISPVLLEAARGQLAHAVGDPDVDNLIALGYLQVCMCT